MVKLKASQVAILCKSSHSHNNHLCWGFCFLHSIFDFIWLKIKFLKPKSHRISCIESLFYQVCMWNNMYTSRGNNAYGQQSYVGQSAYGQNVSLYNLQCLLIFLLVEFQMLICCVSWFGFSFQIGVFIFSFNLKQLWNFPHVCVKKKKLCLCLCL
jgi:hypothetical protein